MFLAAFILFYWTCCSKINAAIKQMFLANCLSIISIFLILLCMRQNICKAKLQPITSCELGT